MINRSRQNNGYPWQIEGDRGNFNVPKQLIPLLKQIAYNLDKEQVSGDSKVIINNSESEIIIKIIKN